MKGALGLEKLIASFDDQHPGRGYFGKPRGWLTGDKVSTRELAEAPEYDSLESMAEHVINALIVPTPPWLWRVVSFD
ncbi:MAG: hypothetical protein ACI8T1_000340 [Verrucomicrobiales bacterium]|jgi:hypothetical protein